VVVLVNDDVEDADDDDDDDDDDDEEEEEETPFCTLSGVDVDRELSVGERDDDEDVDLLVCDELDELETGGESSRLGCGCILWCPPVVVVVCCGVT
jgi:hypothetical protein